MFALGLVLMIAGAALVYFQRQNGAGPSCAYCFGNFGNDWRHVPVLFGDGVYPIDY